MGGFECAYLWGVEMKYEITKGSEKDFEGSSDKCLIIARHRRQGWIKRMGEFVDGAECLGEKSCIHSTCNWEVIAERRPITEPVVNQQLTTEWDGEGLPPVGTKCECDSAGDWQECTVILSVDNAIVWQWDWQRPNNACISYAHCAPKFRPIRSPEDVARDESIEAMRDVGYTLPAAIRFTKEEMTALYDAGYRKME